MMIINHTDCGLFKFSDSEVEDRFRKETGQAPVAPARFYSFTDVEKNIGEQVQGQVASMDPAGRSSPGDRHWLDSQDGAVMHCGGCMRLIQNAGIDP